MATNHTIRAREDAATLKDWLHDGQEIALLDVREHGQYGEAHLFYAVNAPYSRLEFEVARLVPRKTTRVVSTTTMTVSPSAPPRRCVSRAIPR